MKAILPLICLVASVTVVASAQEAGSVEAYRIEVRARNRAIEAAQAKAIADHEAMFAGVKDIEAFIKVAHEDRQQRVKSYYALREKERSSQEGRPRDRRQKIQAWNNRILSINDPMKPYIPDVAAKNVITLDVTDDYVRQLRVRQVIDEQNAIMELRNAQAGSTDREFWLTGTDTSGWADDERSGLTGLFLAVGSKTFGTASGGSRTIPMMKLIDLKPYEDALTRRAEIRSWTKKNGTTVEGILMLCDSGRVTISELDGTKTTLKLSELSEADWDYVSLHAPTPKRRVPRQQARPAKVDVGKE